MYENLKKKFGQNFLIDKNILKKIETLISYKNLNILEIGPGDGKLTEYLVKKNPKKLNLIEIDNDLVSNLKKKYSKNENVNIIHGDILNYNFNSSYDLVVSNLPYNISSQVLVKFSTIIYKPNKMILMFQKEFADRLLDSKLNSINALVNCFYNVRFNFKVGRNCFRPIPKVDSSVLTFERKEKYLLEEKELPNYILFKRKLFSHKRKILKNLLKNYDIKDDSYFNLRIENLELYQLITIFREANL